MESIATSDPAIHPYLCRRTNVTRFIYVKAKKQLDSCAVGTNPQPCHPSSGDKSRSETDFTFAGRPFTRFYHSLRESMPVGFRMGVGWSHSFATRMHGGPRMLVTAEGNWAPYINDSTGRWLVPNLGNASLDETADGSWRLAEAGGDVSTFVAGRLTQISTPGSPERDVTLEYNVSGQLSRIVDMTGKALIFVYNRWNQLSQITLPGGTVYSYAYDSNENLTAVASSAGGTKQYHYGEAGLSNSADPNLLTGITYEDGIRFGSFGYDIHGRVLLSTLHASAGQFTETTRLHYPTANSAQVTLPSGLTQTFTYTADIYRKPLTIADSSGTTTNTYDSVGRLLTTIDGRGVQTRYVYTNGRKTAATSAFSTSVQRTEQTDWHATLNAPTERRILNASSALVGKANWTYNARGQVLTTSQTDPISGATRTSTNTYCEQADVDAGICPRIGLVSASDGPRPGIADTTSYMYYPGNHPDCNTAPSNCPHRKGMLWKVANPLGQLTETLTYDGEGRPASVKDVNGTVTELTYHPRGWLTSRTVKGATSSEDRSTLIDYSPTGRVKRVSQADGSYTEYSYDAAGRLTRVADSSGNSVAYELDSAGNRTGESTRDPNGALTRTLSRVFDQLGRLQSQADAYGHVTGFANDANGNTTVVTDALNRGTANAYDPLNRLTQTIQDIGGIAATTQFKYDAQDNLTRVTDPKGLHTDYSYNGLGDLEQLSSPDTGITRYTYDSAGNRQTQTDARGVTATYTYDVLNRLTAIAYPTSSLDVSYRYDTANGICTGGESHPVGKLTSIVDGSGSTQYCYNRFGDVTRKHQITNGLTFTTRYHYDGAGRLASQTYPDGAVLDAVRDGEGRITELGITPFGTSRQIVLTGASYAPFGPSIGWTYGNGRGFQRSLNQNYQPQAIHDAAVGGLSLRFGFDAVGNLTQLEDAAQTQVLAQYGYDALNRLQQTRDGPTGTPIDTYNYDATGNRTSELKAGLATAYTYPAASHRLADKGGVMRSYDAMGNTTGLSTGVGYAYSDSGRMELVTQGAGVQAQYAYNGKGEQVRRTQGADDTYFAYDEAGHLIGQYDGSGLPVQQVLWFGDLPVGVLQGAGASQQVHYIEPDHLGTPRVVIDGTRNVAIWKWDTTGEAFGATPPNQNPDGDAANFVFNLRFPGQRYDAASGLNYNYFRDYEPGTGRYAQSDPLGITDGPSTYTYVQSSPLYSFDKLGLATYSGFSPKDQARMEEAVRQSVEKLRACKGCNDCGPSGERSAYCIDEFKKFQIVAALNDAHFSYSPSNFSVVDGSNICGEHLGQNYSITPNGLRGCKGSRTLSCLLTHEVSHFILGGKEAHRQILYIEDRCLGCKKVWDSEIK